MPLKKASPATQHVAIETPLKTKTISAKCKVKKPTKNYMTYIRKKANMQGGQASKLKQSILLERVDEKQRLRCIMGKGKGKGNGKGKGKGEGKGEGKSEGKGTGKGYREC
jgi:hypothetical protein